MNSRLDEMQAAMLRVKLATLDADNETRRQLAQRYLRRLSGTGVELPAVTESAEPVWHLFVMRHSRRDEIQRRLAEQGIGTMIHYPRACHRQPAYATTRWPALPISDALQDQVLSLPMSPVHTVDEIDAVADAVAEIVDRIGESSPRDA
jgi:dTDP-4-amino-4,6-dideoxygalactose transaminase